MKLNDFIYENEVYLRRNVSSEQCSPPIFPILKTVGGVPWWARG